MQTTAPATHRYLDAAEVAKLIRAALKAAFPGVKFSVRSSRFSMGSAVDTAWTDGPTASEVDAILARYQGDIVIDGETVHVLPQYIHSSRSLSDDFTMELVEKIAAAIGTGVSFVGAAHAHVTADGTITANPYREDVATLVHRLAVVTAR